MAEGPPTNQGRQGPAAQPSPLITLIVSSSKQAPLLPYLPRKMISSPFNTSTCLPNPPPSCLSRRKPLSTPSTSDARHLLRQFPHQSHILVTSALNHESHCRSPACPRVSGLLLQAQEIPEQRCGYVTIRREFSPQQMITFALWKRKEEVSCQL